MFGKRPADINANDLIDFVASQPQEGTELELKAALPAKGRSDPWQDGNLQVGDRARRELLAELIAFANAYGGWLVIGVEETKDKPARAEKINPILECVELAERLRLICRDCIDPQLPVLEIAGVPTEPDGAGVVICNVPASRLAPHRHTVTLECYKRHADRTERMTMREIQDLTLQTERGISNLERQISRWQHELDSVISVYDTVENIAFGLRVTALPVALIFVDDVHRNNAATPPLVRFSAKYVDPKYPDSVSFDVGFPSVTPDWRPILRGSQLNEARDSFRIQVTVTKDGQINYQLLRVDSKQVDLDGQKRPFALYAQWAMALVANAMSAAEKFRRAADAPAVEYALGVSISTRNGNVPISEYGANPWNDTRGTLVPGDIEFPIYSLSTSDKFSDVADAFNRDFWNAVGVDERGNLEIDFGVALGDLGN